MLAPLPKNSTLAITILVNTNFSLKEFLLSRPTNPWAQFLKYGLCGGIASVVMFSILLGLNVFFPEFVNPEVHSTEQLARNTNLFATIAFIPSSIVTYLMNRFFVFTPGRHRLSIEFTIFTLVSIASFVGGVIGSNWVVYNFSIAFNILGATITQSQIGNVAFAFSSALVNFICRKFFIFKG